MLRLKLASGTSLCEECGPYVQFSGECHNYRCANDEGLEQIIAQIEQHIHAIRPLFYVSPIPQLALSNFSVDFSTDISTYLVTNGHTPVPDVLSVVHTMHQSDQTNMVLFDCIPIILHRSSLYALYFS